MTAQNDLDRTLGAWFHGDATTTPPSEPLARVIESTRTLRPRPALVARIGSDWVGTGATSGRGRVADLRPAVVFALVALLAVALAGGALLVGSRLIAPRPTPHSLPQPAGAGARPAHGNGEPGAGAPPRRPRARHRQRRRRLHNHRIPPRPGDRRRPACRADRVAWGRQLGRSAARRGRPGHRRRGRPGLRSGVAAVRPGRPDGHLPIGRFGGPAARRARPRRRWHATGWEPRRRPRAPVGRAVQPRHGDVLPDRVDWDADRWRPDGDPARWPCLHGDGPGCRDLRPGDGDVQRRQRDVGRRRTSGRPVRWPSRPLRLDGALRRRLHRCVGPGVAGVLDEQRARAAHGRSHCSTTAVSC